MNNQSTNLWTEGNSGDFYVEENDKKERKKRADERERIISLLTEVEMKTLNEETDELKKRLNECVCDIEKIEEIKEHSLWIFIDWCHPLKSLLMDIFVNIRLEKLKSKKLNLVEQIEYLPDEILKRRKS